MTLFARIFFFNDTATTEIYTLSLHDALPISQLKIDERLTIDFAKHEVLVEGQPVSLRPTEYRLLYHLVQNADRKSTRLNSSHANISYAVFCLKKKTKVNKTAVGVVVTIA